MAWALRLQTEHQWGILEKFNAGASSEGEKKLFMKLLYSKCVLEASCFDLLGFGFYLIADKEQS